MEFGCFFFPFFFVGTSFTKNHLESWEQIEPFFLFRFFQTGQPSQPLYFWQYTLKIWSQRWGFGKGDSFWTFRNIVLVSRSRNFGAEVWVERVEILRILESWAGDHPTFEDTLEIFFFKQTRDFLQLVLQTTPWLREFSTSARFWPSSSQILQAPAIFLAFSSSISICETIKMGATRRFFVGKFVLRCFSRHLIALLFW